MTKTRALTGIAIGAVALAIGAAAAFASNVVKGATYSGQISRIYHGKVIYTDPITFKVTRDGKKVTSFTVTGYPVYCQGGGFGSPHSRSATISRNGTFTVRLPLIFAPAHNQNQGNLIISGKFGRHGSVSGTARTAFTRAKSCNGTSPFRATAKGH